MREEAKKAGNRKRERMPEKTAGTKKTGNANRSIMVVTYLFVLLFLGLMGNLVYFMVTQRESVINNTYNKRQEVLAKQITKGSILSADGKVLAETVTGKDGEEYRSYPYDNMFCHVVGRASKSPTGIEQAYAYTMLGSHDNPFRKIFTEIQGEKNQGDHVITTLQLPLQQAAYRALDGRKGAVVVMEPSTGKLLAMVSGPDYNPNKIDESWEELLAVDEENSALLNRATNGAYPPGSTFKILTALEYIREKEDYENYAYQCEGSVIFDGSRIRCYNGKIHGSEDLEGSFADSCNTSFASMGMQLKIGKFRKLCEKFLFNKPLPVDFDYTSSKFELKKGDDAANITQTAIGQGKTLVSPLHNAMIASVIANNGIMMKPYLVEKVESDDGAVVQETEPAEYDTIISSEKAKVLQGLMRSVVTKGTASALYATSYSSAGKTGSAEYDSNKSSHAWFVGYAPADEPEIAISVIVEGAGTGSDYAVPIAREVFDAYFSD